MGHYALCCAKLLSFRAKDKNLNGDMDPIISGKNVGNDSTLCLKKCTNFETV